MRQAKKNLLKEVTVVVQLSELRQRGVKQIGQALKRQQENSNTFSRLKVWCSNHRATVPHVYLHGDDWSNVVETGNEYTDLWDSGCEQKRPHRLTLLCCYGEDVEEWDDAIRGDRLQQSRGACQGQTRDRVNKQRNEIKVLPQVDLEHCKLGLLMLKAPVCD